MAKKPQKTDKSRALHLERWLSASTKLAPGELGIVFKTAHDEQLSAQERALLFIIYGARIARKEKAQKQPLFKDSDGWFRRAYYFGLKYGIPPQPFMISRILEYEEGLDLSVAYVRECDAAPVFKIKEDLGITLLNSGMDAPGLISLCRALHAIEPLSERLLDASEEIALIHPTMRRVEEPRAIKLRRELVDKLAELIGEYMWRTRSTKVVILLAGFINTMLATAPLTSHLVEKIEMALKEFLKFDDARLVDCLKIEIDQDLGKVTSNMKEVVAILENVASTVD